MQLDILWLFPRHYWERKMSSVRRHSLLAIQRLRDVNLHISGIGWEDYDPELSVEENRLNIMPSAELVGWYKPLGEVESELRPEHETPLRDPTGCSVPCCLRFNEAWWPERLAMKEVVDSGSRLVICHHAEDLEQFSPYNGYQVDSVHIPHSAEKEIFGLEYSEEDRDITILLSGSISTTNDPDLYPLRKRFHRLITSGVLPGELRSKPPFMTSGIDETEAQVRDYARHLARAQIVVMDGTRHEYPLAKYTEAAMSGALVVGNLPKVPPPHFEEFVVPLSLECSDEELIETLTYWVENEEERRDKAQHGRAICLSHYTQEHYAQRFIEAVKTTVR